MFCPNCGKEIRQGANFCIHCGTCVGNIIGDENIQDAIYVDITDVEYNDIMENDNYCDIEYSNCENGKVSFLRMLKKFFSKDIKEYFSFNGTYSRLEYFYLNLIINVFFLIFDPWSQQYFPFMILPSVIVHLWLHISSGVKRLKDLGFSARNILILIICIFIFCIFFSSKNKDNLIPSIVMPSIGIFIFYQIYTLFVPGKKFNNSNKSFEKNKTDKKEKSEEENTFLDYVGMVFFVIIIVMLLIEAF